MDDSRGQNRKKHSLIGRRAYDFPEISFYLGLLLEGAAHPGTQVFSLWPILSRNIPSGMPRGDPDSGQCWQLMPATKG